MNSRKNIEINIGRPFEKDLFNRKSQIESLYEIIKSSDDKFVSCIDSPFGKGKTMFFKMFEAYIEHKNMLGEDEEDILCIYYDAWENDFYEKPLVSIISCFKDSIEKVDNVKSGDLKIIIEEILGNVTSLFSKGVVDPKTLHEKLQNKNGRDYIKEFKNVQENRSYVIDELLKISEDREGFRSLKVIFFIDELDRCKPTFALELLETIKHYFDIKKYYFILAMDKKQIGSTIKKYYGDAIDDVGYLRRFIDFDIEMTPIQIDKYIAYKRDHLIKEMNLTAEDCVKITSAMNHVSDMIKSITNNIDCTLRDIDKIFYYLRLIDSKDWMIKLEEPNGLPNVEISIMEFSTLGFMLTIKVLNSKMYNSIVNKNLTKEELKELDILLRFDNPKIKSKILNNFRTIFIIFYRESLKTINDMDLNYNLYTINDYAITLLALIDYNNLFYGENILNFKAIDMIQLLDGFTID